eukprot:3689925-Rhodomonas_salina.2
MGSGRAEWTERELRLALSPAVLLGFGGGVPGPGSGTLFDTKHLETVEGQHDKVLSSLSP